MASKLPPLSTKRRHLSLTKTARTPDSCISTASSRSVRRSKPNIASVTARNWAVIDGNTGQFLAGKAADEPREIASMTKIMTCYIVL